VAYTISVTAAAAVAVGGHMAMDPSDEPSGYDESPDGGEDDGLDDDDIDDGDGASDCKGVSLTLTLYMAGSLEVAFAVDEADRRRQSTSATIIPTRITTPTEIPA